MRYYTAQHDDGIIVPPSYENNNGDFDAKQDDFASSVDTCVKTSACVAYPKCLEIEICLKREVGSDVLYCLSENNCFEKIEHICIKERACIRKEVENNPRAKKTLHTDGGSAIGGNVDTGGGDFIGRDQHNQYNQFNQVTINIICLNSDSKPGCCNPTEHKAEVKQSDTVDLEYEWDYPCNLFG